MYSIYITMCVCVCCGPLTPPLRVAFYIIVSVEGVCVYGCMCYTCVYVIVVGMGVCLCVHACD